MTATAPARLGRDCLDLEWRDLARLTAGERLAEMLFSAPWLALALALFALDAPLPGLAAEFFFFLAGLRQAHDCFHRNWSAPRWVSDGALVVLSVLMLGSMHAVRWNHLRHHAHCLAADDIEAAPARLGLREVLLYGPRFPLHLHCAALAGASGREWRWMLLELAANLLWIAVVLGVVELAVLRWHLAAMAAGQCLTAFFAVWTVHRHCAAAPYPARTLRQAWKSRLALGMFFHAEHHLYPRVPTRHLPALARRLDQAAPGHGLLLVY